MPKRSRLHLEAVREHILQSARAVFMRKGYEAATMKDIVEQSGRSFGGVYSYYSSKDQLFYDLLKQQFKGMAEEFEPQPSVWGTLETFLDHQLERAYRVEDGLAPCMYEYFIVGRRQEQCRQIIDARLAAVRGSLTGWIQAGVDSGEFQPSVPVDSIVNTLICLLDGVFLESIISGANRFEMAHVFMTIKTFLKSALRAANETS